MWVREGGAYVDPFDFCSRYPFMKLSYIWVAVERNKFALAVV